MIPLLRATVLLTWLCVPAKAAELTVFAAASLGDAMADLASGWEAETGQTVTLVLAGSSTLARQIDAGAPADVFVSANGEWMDWLAEAGRVLPDSRVDIAANRLVLIAHDPTVQSAGDVTTDTDLPGMLGADGRLAIALPEAVPAGIYAKAALMQLGLWEAVAHRLAPTDNVRAALALVASGAAPFGVVYASDAVAEPRVSVVARFPAETHPPILYPLADLANRDTAEESAFVDYLSGPDARAVFEAQGFSVLRP